MGLVLFVTGSCFCLGFLTRSLVRVGDPMSADRSAVAEWSTILSPRSADTSTIRALGAAGAEQVSRVADLMGRLQASEDWSRFARSLLRDDAHRNAESLWGLLLARWSEIDAESMLEFVRDAPGQGIPREVREMAWFAFAVANPEGAAERVRTESEHLRKAAIRGMAAVSPRKAFESALAMPDGQFALRHAIVASQGRQPEDLDAVVRRAVYDGARQPAQEALVELLAKTDPALAIETAQRAGRIWSDPVAKAFAAIGRTEADLAVELLDSLPESRSRSISSVAVAKSWAASDPDAALEWVRSLRSGEVRDTALVAVASVVGGENPMDGLALIEETGWRDSGRFYEVAAIWHGEWRTHREGYESVIMADVAESLLRQWAYADRDGARAYIDERVPESLREPFRQALVAMPQ